MQNVSDKAIVVAGTKLNKWTVLETSVKGATKTQCQCECGRIKQVNIRNMVLGLSKRCKHCSISTRATTHGASDAGGRHAAHRLYRIWKAMKWRCNPKNRTADRGMYYEAGVRVCEEWLHDYPAFRDWALANGYRDDLSIDRWPNKQGSYEPGNCRWSDEVVQARNTKRNRMLTAFDETKPVAEWAEDARCGTNEKAIRRRLKLGWDDLRAITTPTAG